MINIRKYKKIFFTDAASIRIFIIKQICGVLPVCSTHTKSKWTSSTEKDHIYGSISVNAIGFCGTEKDVIDGRENVTKILSRF